MSPISAMIFGIFGGLWIVFAIFSQRHPNALWLVVPIVVSTAIVLWAVSVLRKWEPADAGRSRRVGKIVSYASAFEGFAIFVGINVLDNIGRADLYLPLIALIVGLHFLPFARFLPERRYYLLAAGMVMIALVGWAIASQDLRTAFVGVASALVLWATAGMILKKISANASKWNPPVA